ncbi:hypothetical protein ACP70R_008113 [Stipagrostis hirtigluma subsp. patula]
MANFWKIGAMAWCVTILGWLLSPIISFLVNKFFAYLSVDVSRKLWELEAHSIHYLKKTLMDADEQRILRAAKDKRSESDLIALNKLAKDLKFALYNAEDILDLIDYHRTEKKVKGDDELRGSSWVQHLHDMVGACISRCVVSWFGQRIGSTMEALLRCMKSLYNLIFHGWFSYHHIKTCCQSILSWLANTIAAACFFRDWSYEVVGIKISQKDNISLDSFLRTIDRKSLRERLEQIEYIVTESKKSDLLSQQSSSSNIPVKDTDKESNNRQKDIDELYRSINRKVFGRDKEREHICHILRKGPDAYAPSSSTSKRYSVIGIYGIAGSGKSTLAQYVCDHEEADGKHFDLVIFIHVSKTFKVDHIFRDMLEKIMQERPSDTKGLKSLWKELKEKLKGKRFLLVLDDLWVNDENKKEREILLEALDAGDSGSGILVTARREDAARALGAQELIAISDLEEEEYFSMFMHYALEGTRFYYERYIRIGRRIAEKLHRSPIAAVIVAARLRMNPDIIFWGTTANLDVLNETMGALWWSYQQLGVDVGRCFAYCSTFPRGYKLQRNNLVRMWIAQGFVKTSNPIEDVDDMGQRCFDELLTFSFLQVPTTFYGDEHFTIHDLLHKLAERVAGSDFFRIDVHGLPRDIPTEVHHLFIQTYLRAEIAKKILELGNLRTLIIEGQYDTNPDEISAELHKEMYSLIKEKVIENIFMRLGKLRVLIVRFKSYNDLVFSVPSSIGQMKHLRYISFQSIYPYHLKLIFPSSFSKLYHMQILDIADFQLSCAEDIAHLVHLRHIWAHQDFPNIGSLTSLKTMPSFKVRKEQGYELKQLKHLNKLCTLEIYGLENVGSKQEALEANLACKKRLIKLSLGFNINTCNPDVEAEVLEGLYPPNHLEELIIAYFHGSRYPSWMLSHRNPDASRHLYELELYMCSQLLSIPEDSEFFIRLRKLCISRCSWGALLDNMENLTSLQKLDINHCNEIKLIPTLPRSLEHIRIAGNSILRTSCQEMGHINWQKIGHISSKEFSEW